MGRTFEESMARSGGADDIETPINDKNRDKKSKKEKKKKHKKTEEEELAAEEETRTRDDSNSKKRKSAESELQPAENSENRTKKEEEEEDSNGDVRVLEQAGANGVERVMGVAVTGKDSKDLKYKAFDSFADAGLSAEVLDRCKNFSKPSPIQANSWTFLLNGRDLIGIAAT